MGFLDDFGKILKHPPRIRIPAHIHIPTIKSFAHRFNKNIKLPTPFKRLGEGIDKIIPFHDVIQLGGVNIRNKHVRKFRDRRNIHIIDNNNVTKNKMVKLGGIELPDNLTQTNINKKDLSGKEKTIFNDPKIYIIGSVVVIGVFVMIKKK